MTYYDYECPYCGKQYFNDYHAWISSGELNIVCPDCEKRFVVRVKVTYEYEATTWEGDE